MATCSGCFRTNECRPRFPAQRCRDTEHQLTHDKIEGEVGVLEIQAQERGDRFVAHTGLDSRAPASPYRWFRICPHRVQAWREVREMPDRELMRYGRWLV